MTKFVISAVAAALLCGSAHAADQSPPDPAQLALGQMVGECQSREASALIQVHTLRAQLATEKKRADEAEARKP